MSFQLFLSFEDWASPIHKEFQVPSRAPLKWECFIFVQTKNNGFDSSTIFEIFTYKHILHSFGCAGKHSPAYSLHFRRNSLRQCFIEPVSEISECIDFVRDLLRTTLIAFAHILKQLGFWIFRTVSGNFVILENFNPLKSIRFAEYLKNFITLWKQRNVVTFLWNIVTPKLNLSIFHSLRMWRIPNQA